MKEKKVCKVCGGKYYAKGYCHKHYTQVWKYGETYKTFKDKNDIVVFDNYAEIILYDKYSKEIARTKIDIEDINKIKNYIWGFGSNYVRGKVNGKHILLHRFIMNCPEDKVVDHINGNTLDNRKCNLRICTQSDNMKNRKKHVNNTSGVKGVSWNKCNEAWEVKISKDGKRYYLGMYKDKEEAIKVRKDAEEKYFGEYARGED